MKKQVSTLRYLWTSAILTFVSIMLIAAWGRAVQHVVEHIFGKGILIVITLAFAIAGLVLFYRYIICQPSRRFRHLFLFSIVAGLYTWRLLSLHVQVERFHLIEYGILAILVCLAMEKHGAGWTALGWGLAAAWFGGLSDEFFQWWLPARVGEWRDVVINIQSGALGLGSLMVLRYESFHFKKQSRRKIILLFSTLGFLSLLSGQFVLKVHVFGQEIHNSQIGHFNSIFSENTLRDTTPEIYQKSSTAAGDYINNDYFNAFQHYFYKREAKEHYDKVHLLFEMGQFRKAKSEYLITTTYYYPWMIHHQKQFRREIREKLSNIMPEDPEIFGSQVMDWLLVKTTPEQVRRYSIVFCSVFLITGVGLQFLMLYF